MKTYSGTKFALLTMFRNLQKVRIKLIIILMTKIFVPTLQSGSMRRPPMITWILTIASLHAEHQSMDAKPVLTKIMHSSALEMEPKFVSTKIWFAMVTPSAILPKMKISHSARKNISARSWWSSMQPKSARVRCIQTTLT